MTPRYILPLLLMIQAASALYAQNKYDNTWVLGYTPNKPPIYGGTTIQFNGTRPPALSYFEIPFDFDGVASICDEAGNLLMYTNGCFIANRRHRIMENGEGLNVGGYQHWNGCQRGGYYIVNQGLLLLPWPGRKDQYLLFHLHMPADDNSFTLRLLYTEIDMQGDGGLGVVKGKNVEAFRDTFTDQLTAVRHANGRDWWLVLPKWNAAAYYVFLLSPEGISQPVLQWRQSRRHRNSGTGLQAAFSPNGRWYLNNSFGDGLQIFRFDRCSGQLSEPVALIGWSPKERANSGAVGVAVSASSRFAYATVGGRNLYQFDLNADTIAQSKTLIDTFDRFGENGVPITFYQMMPAPDGKIYMSATNSSLFLHVINSPNLAGRDCGFVQRGLTLKGLHAFAVPNFPHFRLYDVQGSPCDTLGINGPAPTDDTTTRPKRPVVVPCGADASLWPNPAGNFVHLRLPACGAGRAVLCDAVGRLVREVPVPADAVELSIPVHDLPAGIYFLHLERQQGGQVVRAVAVMR